MPQILHLIAPFHIVITIDTVWCLVALHKKNGDQQAVNEERETSEQERDFISQHPAL